MKEGAESVEFVVNRGNEDEEDDVEKKKEGRLVADESALFALNTCCGLGDEKIEEEEG